MADINGVNAPILDDQDYVQKIIDSFAAVDAHDHTSGKGNQIPTGGIEDGAITNVKVNASAAIARTKVAAGTAYRILTNDASGVMSEVGPLTDGQLLIGATGGAPAAAAITGTASQIVVALGTNSITLSTPQDIATTSDVQFGTGVFGVGSKNASAILEAISTTQGFLPPRMTEVQRDAISTPAAGLTVYNTDTNQVNVYNGSAWGAVGGGTVVDTFTGTTITATNDPVQVWRYTGGSAQTLASIDSSSLPDGGVIIIEGTSDINTITLAHNDVLNGWILNGDWVGYQYSKLIIRKNGTVSRLVEDTRNGL